MVLRLTADPWSRVALDADRQVLGSELWPECPVDRHRLEVEQLVKGPGVIALAVADGGIVGFAEVSIRSDHVEGAASAPVPYPEGW